MSEPKKPTVGTLDIQSPGGFYRLGLPVREFKWSYEGVGFIRMKVEIPDWAMRSLAGVESAPVPEPTPEPARPSLWARLGLKRRSTK